VKEMDNYIFKVFGNMYPGKYPNKSTQSLIRKYWALLL